MGSKLNITGARTDHESDKEHPCADQVDLDLSGWSDSDLESNSSVPVQYSDSDSIFFKMNIQFPLIKTKQNENRASSLGASRI